MIKRILVLCGLLALAHNQLHAVFPLAFLRPGATYLRLQHQPKTCYQFDFFAETLHHPYGRTHCGDRVNALHIWQKDQSALAMMRGFAPESPIGQFAARLNDVPDNGTFGHLIPCAQLSAHTYVGTFAYQLRDDFFVSLILPAYDVKLSDVCWQTVGGNQCSQQSVRAEHYLMDNFFEQVRAFDPDLNLTDGWSRHGVGDLVIRADWVGNFVQRKPILKNVQINVHGGLSFPTGKKTDINQLFSIPFGHDGSTGVLFGGSIDLTWYGCWRGGLCVDFMKLFGTTREWRIKTDVDQTDLLLLAKACARKEWGMVQDYTVYTMLDHVFGGCSLGAAYHHIKHNKDKFCLAGQTFSELVANTAESLKEWTTHEFMFSFAVDFGHYLSSECRAIPELSFYYRQPFSGRRVVQGKSIGVEFTLDF